MAQANAQKNGKIIHKNVKPTQFSISYECSCGGVLAFCREEYITCAGCKTRYQCRVIVGRANKQAGAR